MIGFFTRDIQDSLSCCIAVGFCWLNLNSANNVLNHIVSFVPSESAIYSASIVDKAIVFCFRVFQDMIPSFNQNRYPDIECLSSTSFAQSASQDPRKLIILSSKEFPPKVRDKSIVAFKYLKIRKTAVQ